MRAVELPHPLSDLFVELMSERMALLGHSTRIHILDELREGERNVQSIADGLSTTQQNVSGHLRLRRAAGSRAGRRDAEAFYAVVDPTVFEIWECLIAGVQEHRE